MSLVGTGSITVARPIRPREPGERSFLSKVIGRVRSYLARGGSWAAISTGAPGWTDPRWWSDDPDDWPCVASETDALGVPPFGRGVDLIASSVAGVDLAAYRYDKPTRISVKLDPQPSLLRDPDLLTTPWNWRYAVVNDLILYGNSFAFLGAPDSTGWPTSLEPVDVTTVELGVNDDSDRLVWRVNGEVVPYGGLWHVSAGNRSGYLVGRGVIQQYRDALGGVLEVNRHTRGYFRGGGLPSAVIQVQDPDLKQEQAGQIKQAYRDTIGSTRKREPLVIPGHYQFTPVVSDAEKQQLVEARTWDASLVAMILGIPPFYLGLQGPSMTYSNIETQDIAFIRDTVNRWAQPVEHAVTKWLLPMGTTARFEWRDRLRTDTKSRADVLKVELDAGLRTGDEGRRELNLPPLEQTTSVEDLRSLVDAAGIMIRSGYDPEDTLRKLGLDPVKHLGLLPVTVQRPEGVDPAEVTSTPVEVDEPEPVPAALAEANNQPDEQDEEQPEDEDQEDGTNG